MPIINRNSILLKNIEKNEEEAEENKENTQQINEI